MNRVCVLLVALLAAIVMIKAKPITFLDALTNGAEDQFLLRLVDYLGGDYDDSVASESNEPLIRKGRRTGRAENCMLPVKRGMCRALIPRWRYDPITKTCQEFKFGGCDGNSNNFRSYRDCMENCEGV